MKIPNKTILFLALFFAVVNLLIAPGVNAGLWSMQEGLGADSGDIGIGYAFGQTSQGPTDLRVTIGLIIQVFLGFLGFIFFILILWAGYKWMVSRGNENTITEARSQIVAATVGLVIVLMSFAIASFVTRCFAEVSIGGNVWACVF